MTCQKQYQPLCFSQLHAHTHESRSQRLLILTTEICNSDGDEEAGMMNSTISFMLTNRCNIILQSDASWKCAVWVGIIYPGDPDNIQTNLRETY